MRILLLAVIGAAVWVVLSIVGSSTPASAADNPDSADSLLGSVTDAIDESPVVAMVTQPIVTPVSPAVEQVTVQATAVVEQVAPGTAPATVELIGSATDIVGSVVQPVLEQPIIAPALDLLTDADNDIVTVLGGSAAVGDSEPGASLPAVNLVASISNAGAAVAAPGESHAVGEPVPPTPPGVPTAPTSFDATAPAQNLAGQALAAAFLGSSSMTMLAVATTSLQNDALPSSATFDTDCSPD